MHSTSALYKQLLTDPLHRFETIVRCVGQVYTLDKTVNESAVIYGGVFQSPSVGGVAVRQLDLSFIPVGTIPRMAKLSVSVRLTNGLQTSEEIPKGVFYIDSREADKETGMMTVHAFDALLLLKSKAISRDGYTRNEFDNVSKWPMTSRNIMEVIAEELGVEIDPRTQLNSFLIPYQRSKTLRSLAAWIAAAHGGNWTVTDEGKLRLLPLSFGPDGLAVLGNETSTAITFGDIFISVGPLAPGINLTDLGLSMEKLDTSPPLAGWTGVKYTNTNDEVVAQAGNDTGRTLTAVCPFATSEMAQNLLEKINLDEYKPFEAVNAIIDPALELGDAVIVDDFLSVTYQHSTELDDLCAVTISAPADKEIDHEFPPDDSEELEEKIEDVVGEAVAEAIEDALQDEELIGDAVDARIEAALEEDGIIADYISEELGDDGIISEFVDTAIDTAIGEEGAISDFVDTAIDTALGEDGIISEYIDQKLADTLSVQIVQSESSLPAGHQNMNIIFITRE